MEIRDWLENDYYHLLGVRQSALPEEINKAYRHKAKSTHPDAFPINSEEYIYAEKKFKQLLEARDTLLDPEKKNDYDRERQIQQECHFSFIASSYSMPVPTVKEAPPKTSSFKEKLKQKLEEISDDDYVYSHDEQAFVPKIEEEIISKEEKAAIYKQNGAKKFYAMAMQYLGYKDYRRAMVYFRSAQHLDPKIRIPNHYFPD